MSHEDHHKSPVPTAFLKMESASHASKRHMIGPQFTQRFAKHSALCISHAVLAVLAKYVPGHGVCLHSAEYVSGVRQLQIVEQSAMP